MELPCRSRKKKCYHFEDRPPARTPHALQDSTRESTPRDDRVHEYNPESVLAALSNGPEPVASVEQAEPDPIPSHWLRGLPQDASASPATVYRQRQLKWYRRHRRRDVPDPSEYQRAYLLEVGALVELPKSTTDVLLPIYISVLDDLIPIVDGARLFREYSNQQCSIHLIKAVCLVTSKTRQAAPFLRMEENGDTLQPLEFAHRLLATLDIALKADLEPDRVTKIQILALMHLHNDGKGRTNGMDRSSGHLSQAISEAWALSLHWKIPGNVDQEQCDYLWWTLRNMDRLNKPIQGAAPFIIDDADIAIERIRPNDAVHRSRVMEVSLKLGDLMIVATRVYKATSTATSDDEYALIPAFEALVADSAFAAFHRAHRAYLEIWYHVAAMLSCRYSGPGSRHYARRVSSAQRILEIVKRDGVDGLPPLPLVPYAMSMSTTMIYRAFRDGQRGPNATYNDLTSCCDSLDVLSERWTTAKGIAKLAKRLLKILRRSSSMPRPAHHTLEELQGPDLPATDRSAPTAETGIRDGDSTNDNPNCQVLVQPEALQNMDASYSHMDRAFAELFDYSMPNVFRGPANLDYFMPTDEEGSTGSGFQFSSYLSPEVDFGYPVVPELNEHPSGSG